MMHFTSTEAEDYSHTLIYFELWYFENSLGFVVEALHRAVKSFQENINITKKPFLPNLFDIK